MNILIIGSGGREHALAWKAKQSYNIETIFVAPGNAGTELEYNIKNININELNFLSLSNFIKNNNIKITIIGPEKPLVEGIVNNLKNQNIYCFGPSKIASQLEGSKAFSKNFIKRYDIPTANYGIFNNFEKAKAYIKKIKTPIVIKADGLAAGKGVFITKNHIEATKIASKILENKKFGIEGSSIIIEEFLVGEEVSFIVMVDGTDVITFATSQDHKSRDENEKGPNTGGMGAYSPAPIVTNTIYSYIINYIIKPTVYGMLTDGNRYRGFLYAGLIIDKKNNVRVLEYNCRLGDPETQAIMLRLKSNIIKLCLAACQKKLYNHKITWSTKSSISIVLASGGYPELYKIGKIINGIPKERKNIKTFHAGTLSNYNKNIMTNGGRVLCVTIINKNIFKAQKIAYSQVNKIKWHNLYYRKDIGFRAILNHN